MTIAGTIFDTINDNWGSGGYAGAAPSIDCTETQKSTDVVATDVIEVRHYSLRETGKQINDKYVDRHYSIEVYISSKTSNAQLKLLYDEVEYLLRNTSMTGIQLEKMDKDWSVMNWEQGRHSVILRVYVLAPLSDGAVTSAAGVTSGVWHLVPTFMSAADGGYTIQYYYGACIYLPNADNNCRLMATFVIPNGFPDTGTLTFLFAMTQIAGWGDYSGVIYIARHKTGETVSSYNVANGTAFDFASTGSDNLLAEKTYALTSLEAGDRIGVQFVSDAANTVRLWVVGVWIES